MNPKPHGIKASLLGMVKQVPKSSDHKFGNFFMAVHKNVDGIKDIKSLDGMHGVFGSKIGGKNTF